MAYLKTAITFGLVHIPTELTPIIKNNDTSFNFLHKKCLNRISYKKYCPICKKSVTNSDLVKGYEYIDEKYVVFEQEDFEKLKTKEDKNIEIISFVNEKEIDPIYYEKSYYLKTNKKNKAFSLFKNALKKSKKVAIGKTVIGSKLYYVVLRFGSDNIVMTTLYYKEEVKELKEEVVDDLYTEKEMNLALELIENMSGEFEPDNYIDEYQNKIKNAIDKKINGKEIKQTKSKKNITVTNLMDALEKSLKRA